MSAAILAFDDPHATWWAEADRLARAMEVRGLPQEPFDRLQDRHLALLQRIAETPARTVAGALAQIRVARIGIEFGEAEWDGTALANAIATLERLSTAPRPLAVA